MNLRVVSCLAVCLCAVMVSCVSLTSGSTTTLDTTPDPDAVQSAQETVVAIAGVQPGGIPEHFTQGGAGEYPREEGDFDPNSYFGVLDHLSMEDGYVLEYLYVFDGMGGYPFLYARPSDKAPYTSSDELVADLGENTDYYSQHIQIDDTREGYFQFVALHMMADQFYLWWHAGYNDTTIVFDEESLERALANTEASFEGVDVPNSVKRRARNLDLQPTVEFTDTTTAVVRLVTFSMWGGFTEARYTISREFPHSITDVETVVLVEYDCGVQF
jgi:hypothetical protein